MKISVGSVSLVLEALLELLEDLARPHKTVLSHPPHVLLSELYALELIADCCASSWRPVKQVWEDNVANRASGSFPAPPSPLHEVLVRRIFEVIRLLFEPIPDDYTLPAKTILDEVIEPASIFRPDEPAQIPSSAASEEPLESARILRARSASIEAQVKTIVEFVTVTSWSHAFEYFRNVLYTVRTAVPVQGAPLPNAAAVEDERAALVVFRLVSSFWVDGQKLHLVIQEFFSSYLHFRKPFQNAVAFVTPLLIMRWLDRFPHEFIELHTMQKRRDNGPDTLFDMTLAITENGRRKALLYPLQTVLLFLLPDVFEVASNLREAKSSGMAKKVAFLETLRKALRNRNEHAAYCLVSLLRVARHFDADGDSALLSYAMDVQDDVREAVFRRFSPGADDVVLFDQDIMTAAFVSLTHLNFDSSVDSLVQSCLSASSPHGFKIAVVQACSHFARLPSRERYTALFKAASSFIQGELKVCGCACASECSSVSSEYERVRRAPAGAVSSHANYLRMAFRPCRISWRMPM